MARIAFVAFLCFLFGLIVRAPEVEARHLKVYSP
jgi:hypothetical protein